MTARKISAYWLIVGAATLGLAVTAYFKGASLHSSPTVRILVVLLAGAILLLARGLLMLSWNWLAQHAPSRRVGRYRRDSAARMTAPGDSDWQRKIAHELRARYGRRWRYRLPWVLVSGEEQLIANQLPALFKHHWFATHDMVMLWAPCGSNGLPDETWLRKLYKLRWRKSVDAVALIVDGKSDPVTWQRRVSALGSFFFEMARTLRLAPRPCH